MFDFKSLISPALNFLPAITGQIQARRNFKQALKFQKQEADATRAYNKESATTAYERSVNLWRMNALHNEQLNDKQFQQQKEMFRLTNDYNSPSSVIARSQAAGLNPDLLYGSSGSTIQATMPSAPTAGYGSSPGVPQESPATPVDYSILTQRPTINDMFTNMLFNKQTYKNILKTDSEISKLEAEKKQTISNTSWIDALNTSQLEINGTQVQLNKDTSKLTKIQQRALRINIQKVTQEIQNLQANADLVKVQIANVNESTVAQKIENAYKDVNLSLQIRQLANQIKLTEAQTKSVLTNTALSVLGYQLNEKVTNSKLMTEELQRNNLQITGDQLNLNLESDRQYKDFERSYRFVGVLGKILGAIK